MTSSINNNYQDLLHHKSLLIKDELNIKLYMNQVLLPKDSNNQVPSKIQINLVAK